MDLTNLNEVWNTITHGLDIIYSYGLEKDITIVSITKKDYIKLYTLVYETCNKFRRTYPMPVPEPISPAEFMYNKLQEYLKMKTQQIADKYHAKLIISGLDVYNNIWEGYKLSSVIITNLFGYIDRIWVKLEHDKDTDVVGIYKLAQIIWMNNVLEKWIPQINIIINSMMDTKRQDYHPSISIASINNYANGLLTHLGCNTNSDPIEVYKKYYENNFINHTLEYYSFKQQQIRNTNDITEYITRINIWLDFETNCEKNAFIYTGSTYEFNRQLSNCLILDVIEQMLTEFPNYFHSRRYAEIRLLYQHFCRVNQQKNLADKFNLLMNELGQDTCKSLTAETTPTEFITTCLGIYKFGSELVKQQFQNDPIFNTAFDLACHKFINEPPKPLVASELVAKYADTILRDSKYSIDELEYIFVDCINIFKYLNDKDIFQKFYARLMAKRLISGKYISDDAECNMLSKLKILCGADFTSKMEIMCKDLATSRELNQKYKSQIIKTKKSGNLPANEVMVLTSGSWPIQSVFSILLPRELIGVVEKFTTFYLSHTQGRKLNWQHNLSYGDLAVNYTKTRHVFQASGVQMVILLSFNQSVEMGFEDLVHATGLKPEILLPQMDLLCKMKIIKYGGIEGNVAAENYILNKDYSYKKFRVNINQPVKSETKKETSELIKSSESDRTFTIQAAIVRIMKSRNVLGHNMLITELLAQLGKYFTPNISLVKKCIDSLIEKEYIRRSEGKRDEYTYIA